MKKILFVVMAVIAASFASCNSKSNDAVTSENTNDTTTVEVVDTTVVDSVVVAE